MITSPTLMGYQGSVARRPALLSNPYALDLRFQGANNATTAADLAGRTFTAHGAAALSTGSPKYGVSEALVPDTDSYWEAAGDAKLALGAGDYAIQYWGRMDSDNGTIIDADCDNGGFCVAALNSQQLFFYSSAGAYIDNFYLAPYSGDLKTGDRYLCLQRRGGVVEMFYETAYMAFHTQTDASNYSAVPSVVQAGHRAMYPTSRPFVGQLHGLRVRVGSYAHEPANLSAIPSPLDP